MSEEEYMEECERKYIERHTTHIKGYTEEYVNNLQQKVEQLENIRKKAIEFTNSHFKQMVADDEAQVLLNILNKGE